MKFSRVLTGLVLVLSVVACSDDDSSVGGGGGSGSGGSTGGAAISIQEFMASSVPECGGLQSRDQALVARTDFKLSNGAPVVRWVTVQIFPNGTFAYHVLERHTQNRQEYDVREGQWRANGQSITLNGIGKMTLVRKPGFVGAMLKTATGPALGLIWTLGVNLVSRRTEIPECSISNNPMITRNGDEYLILGRPAAEFYQRQLIDPVRSSAWRWISGYRLDSSGRKIWAGLRLHDNGTYSFRLDGTKLGDGRWEIREGMVILAGVGLVIPSQSHVPILVFTESVADLSAPVRFELDHSTN